MDKILTSPNKMKIREYFEVYQLYKVYTDKVYLDFSDIYITYSLAKLSHYCLKSYKIKKQVGLMFFFLSQQFITWGVMAVCAYKRNYVWSINTLTFLYSYPTQRTTKELNP